MQRVPPGYLDDTSQASEALLICGPQNQPLHAFHDLRLLGFVLYGDKHHDDEIKTSNCLS